VALLRDVSTNRTQLFRHEVEPFTPEQRAIAELSSAMSPKARQALVTLLELLLNEHAEAPAITRTTRPAR
jgi:hypothetical protein